MNHGQMMRLLWIEAKLWQEFNLCRQDIMDAFGVSQPQASKDLRMYSELFPRSMIYNKTAKRYQPASFNYLHAASDYHQLDAVLKAQEVVKQTLSREPWSTKG